MRLSFQSASALALLLCSIGACSNTPTEESGKLRPADYGRSCAKNDDCLDKACPPVSESGGGACSMVCTEASDCVPGWTCGPIRDREDSICQCSKAPERCDSLDNDCNGIVDDNCSGCPLGQHDNGHGLCVADGCADGYHDGGAGDCVPTGQCSMGYHDGGLGLCLTADACALGYHDGGNGQCMAVGTCAPGYHDGGDGTCIAVGCLAGYHDGGGGSCVASGCANGYHDNGVGTCVLTGCAAGYYDGGNSCVSSGCSPGYHDDGLGTRDPAGPAGHCRMWDCADGFTYNSANAQCIADGMSCQSAVFVTAPANLSAHSSTVGAPSGPGCHSAAGKGEWFVVEVKQGETVLFSATGGNYTGYNMVLNVLDSCAATACAQSASTFNINSYTASVSLSNGTSARKLYWVLAQFGGGGQSGNFPVTLTK